MGFGDPLGSSRESSPFLIGPTVELRLPAGFAIEASALYRRLGYSYSFHYAPEAGVSTLVSGRVRGNSWEFPVVGKYYFKSPESAWQPFLGTGWSLRTIGWNTETSMGDNSSRSRLNAGATFSAGVRVRVGRFSLLPEFRYTRWGALDTRRNDGGFYLGFRF